MIKHIRHDSMRTEVLYAMAFLIVVFLAGIGRPFSAHESGIFDPTADTQQKPAYNLRAFETVSVQAKAYVLYDVNSKEVIVGRNEHQILPLASITKVMTALTAVHVASSSTRIIVNKNSLDGGYDLGLKERQVWTLDELLKYTLVFSSNDGAQLIADSLLGRKAFIEKMNTYSRELGFPMSFSQPAGLDVGDELGGIGSAYDVARMMAYARTTIPAILDATTKTRTNVMASTGEVRGIPNTNQLVNDFIGVEGSKTGFTDSAGGNLVLSVEASLGRPVIIVVLGSTKEARFSDAYALYLALIQSIQ